MRQRVVGWRRRGMVFRNTPTGFEQMDGNSSRQAGDADRGLDRRDFLKRGSLASLFAVVGGQQVMAAEIRPRTGPTYSRLDGREQADLGIIGFGDWGREIASTLGRMKGARVAAISDTFPVMLQRANRSNPDAATHEDYRRILEDPAIRAVIVATPTHMHREVVVAALGAGKHVYCEMPLAHTVDDARAIAQAAKGAGRQVFQVGLNYRSNPQHREVFQFIRSGALGQATTARAQWHRKNSWRRASATRERERELNWRLNPAVSLGLIGEVGVHQLDTADWIFQGLPSAVSGYGQVMHWKDGRTVPDTVQAVYEFPSGVHMTYNATLTNSFDGEYDMFYGSDGTIMMRDSKAWLFKEVDAPLLGWEVYARKDRFYRESGIALVADATQLAAQGVDPTADDPNVETPLYYALEEFADNVLRGPFPPSAGYKHGFDATVAAIKANEAITGNKRVELPDSLYNAVT
jgi:predicted dehydrogenase